jgi:hypothetical protein
VSAVKATWKNGQVVLEGKAEWPEGRQLVVLEAPGGEIVFLTEEEQSDSPQAVQEWIDDLRAIPPLPMTPVQDAEMHDWSRKSKEFNIEAVRRQMEEGIR